LQHIFIAIHTFIATDIFIAIHTFIATHIFPSPSSLNIVCLT
jgi:hypothetical protein